MTEWWTVQQSNALGAVGGSLLGVVGGGLGSLMGVCAPRGLFKTPIVSLHVLVILAAAALLGIGMYANISGQPRHVFNPLILAGSIGLGVLAGLLPMTLWAYRAAAARAQSTSTPDADVRAPNTALLRALIESWGVGGPLRALSLRICAAMLIVALVSIVFATTSQPIPLGSSVLSSPERLLAPWTLWAIAAFGPALAALMYWLLPRSFLKMANNAQALLDQQRLAAEELRRG